MAAVGLVGARAGAAGAAAGTATSTLGRWLFWGALGGGGIMAVVTLYAPASEHPYLAVGSTPQVSTPMTRPTQDPAQPERALAATPSTSAASTGLPAKAEPPRGHGRGSKASIGSLLSAETEALDGARSALQRQDYGTALARVDEYQTKFPQGVLAPEASALRVQILHGMGRQPEADENARLFLEQHPRSPLGDRVRDARSPASATPVASSGR